MPWNILNNWKSSIVILNQKISYLKRKINQASKSLILVAPPLSTKKFTPIFNQDSIEHQKSCWASLILQPLICGVWGVSWLNFTSDILYSREKVKMIKCQELWKWEMLLLEMSFKSLKEKWSSLQLTKKRECLSQSCSKIQGANFENLTESPSTT